MRAAVNVHGHVSIALAGAIAVAVLPLMPGVARLASDVFTTLQAELPSAREDRARARVILPEGTYPRAHISYGKDQTRLAATELEWAR